MKGQFYSVFFFFFLFFDHNIVKLESQYGRVNSISSKKALVEFSSLNIATPFHTGHFRFTIPSEYISILNENFGWKVTKTNYLGYYGKQFVILAIGCETFGDWSKLEMDPTIYLFKFMLKKINQSKRRKR